MAPNALRIPISRVRSVTVTSMMFVTPIPPTSNEIPATAASIAVNVEVADVRAVSSWLWLEIEYVASVGLVIFNVELMIVVASACAAMSGPGHGGANERVLHMLQEIGSVDRVAAFVKELKANPRRLPGLGQVAYMQRDPRASIIREIAEEVYAEVGPPALLPVAINADIAAGTWEILLFPGALDLLLVSGSGSFGTPVPLPGAVWLLGSALLLGARAARRRAG